MSSFFSIQFLASPRLHVGQAFYSRARGSGPSTHLNVAEDRIWPRGSGFLGSLPNSERHFSDAPEDSLLQTIPSPENSGQWLFTMERTCWLVMDTSSLAILREVDNRLSNSPGLL